MTEQQAMNAIRVGASEAFTKRQENLTPTELCLYAHGAYALLTSLAKASGWPKAAVLRTAARLVREAREKFIPNCRGPL